MNLVISGAVTEAFGLLIFVIGLLAVRGAVPASVIWLPLLLVPQILFTAGLCWILAAIGVFVRDLGQIIGYLLTLWFFLTPICYPESSLISCRERDRTAAVQSAVRPGAGLSRDVSGESRAVDAGSGRVVDCVGRGGGDGIRLVPPAAQEFRGCDLIRHRVVPLASLDLVILVRHLELEFPVAPVFFGLVGV